MPALKGYTEMVHDTPYILKGLGNTALGTARLGAEALYDLGDTAFSAAKLVGKVGLSALKGTLLAPYYATKGIGNTYHYGRKGVASVSGGLDKLKKAPLPVRLAAFGGSIWAINKMDEAASRVADMRQQARQMKFAAAENDEKPNIPVDNSKPNSNSPEDYADYYDYQEWATTKGNNYPERNETEQNYFDNPHKQLPNADYSAPKLAHVLGVDVYVVDAINDYSGKQRVKVATSYVEPFPELKDRIGSRILAASMVGLTPAMAVAYINPDVYDGGEREWRHLYQN